MRFAGAVFSSWLFVTFVYIASLYIDGPPLVTDYLKQAAVFWMMVGLFSAIYFGVMGLPILYFFSRRKRVSRFEFVLAGLVASIPMLVFCTVMGELWWVVATVVAGAGAGWVFTMALPSQPAT